MGFDVFISHPHQDKSVADAACASLEAAGIRCWIAPRDISPGADWAAAIVEAINRCRVMVLIFSSSTNTSAQVRREVQQAFNHEKPVVPFRIEDVVPKEALAYYMGSVHWLDALTPPLERHLQKLTASVQALVNAAPSAGGHDEERLREDAERRLDAAAAVHVRTAKKGRIEVVQLAVMELDRDAKSGARAFWADWAPSGNHVVTVGTSHDAQLWDVATGECFERLSGHESYVRHATYSRDGRLVATVCDDGSVRIWDLNDNRFSPFFCASTRGWLPRQVSISNANDLVACADFAGRVSIFRIAEGGDKEPVLQFKAQRSYCLASEFSPSNDSILTCGAEGTAELWPIPDLTALPDQFNPRTSLVFRGHTRSVHNASFAASGSLIATASRDGTARVWDAKTGRQTFCTPRFPLALNTGHISASSSMLLVTGDDNSVRIWSLETGELMAAVSGHDEAVRSARFSPDEEKFVTASFDNTVRIWTIRNAQ